MSESAPPLSDLNDRSREIFRLLVETYLETGEPVGSRTLSKRVPSRLSAASIRNVMQDLEQLGLLDSPHVSAGRRPTHSGLRLFVDGMMEFGGLTPEEKQTIEKSVSGDLGSIEKVLDQAGAALSGLSNAASLVLAPKTDAPVKHLDFVALGGGQVLVVMVKEDGQIENRLIDEPKGLTPSAMREAANYLNAQLRGRTLMEANQDLGAMIDARRRELGQIANRLVDAGLATWTDTLTDAETPDFAPDRLIIRGQANLLTENDLEKDIERMRLLFEDLERKRDLAQLVDLTAEGDGVRVFIGAENKLFSMAGSSLIISPYMNAERKVVGAIGVIGPTRMNYGRIVPIVDYTARLMGQILADRQGNGGPS